MPSVLRPLLTLIGVFAASAALGFSAQAQQGKYPKQADLPNPYRLDENWPTLPASMNGGHWGELIRADIDPKGNIAKVFVKVSPAAHSEEVLAALAALQKS